MGLGSRLNKKNAELTPVLFSLQDCGHNVTNYIPCHGRMYPQTVTMNKPFLLSSCFGQEFDPSNEKKEVLQTEKNPCSQWLMVAFLLALKLLGSHLMETASWWDLYSHTLSIQTPP